ncbi:carboxypeptidase regulatory-like domain-containing protein [Acidicapsa dinghuensis]|uniref:Carboxypeptidase regulatory-like domain-containing protein n=1 Tax=Acidicapsa dinghuensis TaxID=2218256 RepID=A0ABW1ECY9_9BACT|nr:carboxypeptidase-like regulatory domain-containing protein [Acidicapsa dinghuensis]
MSYIAALVRKFLSGMFAAAFCLGAPNFSYADANSATLTITISDPSGAVIPDASATLRNSDTNQQQMSASSKTGNADFPFLKPGRYTLTVSKNGFSDVTVANILLNVGDDKHIQLVLKVGSASQNVTVDASGLNINTTDASVSTVIDRNFVENIPLNGRSFQSLMTLAPGVSQIPPPSTESTGSIIGMTGEIVVNGQRTESNYFTVDGVSANTGVSPISFGTGAGASGAVAGETALGTTQSLVSIDDLQEFRATTSTYSAEFGRTPGGQFSFSTRSGTNDWHGTLFDYLRNDALDASNWFNDYYGYPKGKERQNDFGGTVGGPLVIPGAYNGQNRSFFFFSYEGLRLDAPQAATAISVPDSNLRQQSTAPIQPLLNAFPVANGGEDGLSDGLAYYIEAISYPAHLNNTSIRLDQNLGDHFKIFGRFAATPSDTTSYSAAIKQVQSASNDAATLGLTSLVSARQANELRFNFTKADGSYAATSTSLGGAVPLALSNLPGPNGNGFPSDGSELVALFEFGGEPTFELENIPSRQHQFNITDTHTISLGKHALKFGLDWRLLSTTLTPINPEAEYVFSSEPQILASTTAVTVVQQQAPTAVKPVYTAFSTFVQDEWKVSSRLSTSLGLRWDINPAPHSSEGPSPYTLNQITDLLTAELAPEGTPLWHTDWLGFAPRVGVAYQLHQDPNRATVLRAGFGIFYDMGNTQGSEGYQGIGIRSLTRLSSASFPLTSSQLQVPPASAAAPYTSTVFAFDPNLRLPYSLQYNLGVEQALGKQQSVTFNYVGSGGRKLLTLFSSLPGRVGNPNFASSGELELTQGRASSNYNSLQIKYQRALIHGLQGLASYTWSHSIDDDSSNFAVYELLRSSSDFDIRHNLQAALTYDVPIIQTSRLQRALLSEWGLDLRLQARSSLPVNVTGSLTIDPSSGDYMTFQPNYVSGQPLYIYGERYPGKRVINYSAFQTAAADTNGDLPRNVVNGLDAVQLDAALHREFLLEKGVSLQFKAEAFNAFNHPIFGAIYNSLNDGPNEFGYAYSTLNSFLGGLNPLYQVGGPRSLQLSLKLLF